MAGEDRKTIDDIIRTLNSTTLNGAERLVGRDGAGDFKVVLTQLKDWMSSFFAADTPSRIIPGQLTLSYSDTTTFGVATGSIIDDTFAYALSLLSAFTKTLSAWAVGTGNGSLDTGSVAASTTYHVYLIRKDYDGSIDILISISATAPTMPTGYTYKRRIGCFRTNVSSQIIKFYQHGNMFRFDAQIDDRAVAVLANNTRNLLTVSAPENCVGIFSISWKNESAAWKYGIVQATEETDSAASGTNNTLMMSLDNNAVSLEQKVFIDSSRQIAYRGSATTISLRVGCLGWIDPSI